MGLFTGDPIVELASRVHALANQPGAQIELVIGCAASAVEQIPDVDLRQWLTEEACVDPDRMLALARIIPKPGDVKRQVAWRNAQTVIGALLENLPPLPANGEIGNGRPKGESRCDIITPTFVKAESKPSERGTDPDYILGRMKRDGKTDLVNAVINGLMSPAKAALNAGYRKPYIQVRGDDAEKAIRKLIETYTVDELDAAISAIKNRETPA